MTAKIVEVLAKILENINLKQIPLEEFNKNLLKETEFDKQTISAAFSLVYDKLLNINLTERNKTQSLQIRILTQEEVDVIGINNYNYLLYLLNVGLITFADMDLILEQLLLFPGEYITKDDINWIVFISLIDFDSEVLPGSRVLLYSSDVIN